MLTRAAMCENGTALLVLASVVATLRSDAPVGLLEPLC
jgi:hypothetical protein